MNTLGLGDTGISRALGHTPNSGNLFSVNYAQVGALIVPGVVFIWVQQRGFNTLLFQD